MSIIYCIAANSLVSGMKYHK